VTFAVLFKRMAGYVLETTLQATDLISIYFWRSRFYLFFFWNNFVWN